MHVDGSGVDGVGASTDGKVVGLLQCKWAYWCEVIELASPSSQGKVRQIIAALTSSQRRAVTRWRRVLVAAAYCISDNQTFGRTSTCPVVAHPGE
jgi:hypothetical protein